MKKLYSVFEVNEYLEVCFRVSDPRSIGIKFRETDKGDASKNYVLMFDNELLNEARSKEETRRKIEEVLKTFIRGEKKELNVWSTIILSALTHERTWTLT